MAYIPGDAMSYGDAAMYDPLYAMDYPIVLIVIQYRLSVFGSYIKYGRPVGRAEI